ncbi:alternative oxidase [Diplocarpon rosae]|nr:alternative oxidase [Diplocarpon rosae]
MQHSKSRAKWMEVLGFDEDYSSQESRSNSDSSPTYSSDEKEHTDELIRRLLPCPPVYSAYPRLPRNITFFRSKDDILIRASSPPAPAQDDMDLLPAPPPQQFYVTIQRDTSSAICPRPEISLHSGPSKASSVISFAKFHSVTQATSITLCPTPTSAVSKFVMTNFSRPRFPEKERIRPKFKFEELVPRSGILRSEKYEFCHSLRWTGKREKFEWRHASGPFTRMVDKNSGGLRLVRVSTGDVIAVYAGLRPTLRATHPSRMLGMFRFLRGDGMTDLGEEFEMLAVMTILSLVERGRRPQRRTRRLSD